MDTPTTARVERQVVVASRVGLHARPASLLVKAATQQPAVVHIAKDGDPVDARSLLSILTLGAGHGDTVTLSAEGDGAEAAVTAIAELLATELDAEA